MAGPLDTKPPASGGDPSAMRGAVRTSLASWVIQKAANAIGGVRGTTASPQASQPIPSNTPVLQGQIMPPTPSQQQAMAPVRREPWFGPGQPQAAQAPRADVAGRAFDYAPGANMSSKPRQYSGVSFEQLRGLANALDIARLCIETRKDQMSRLTWSCLPKQTAGQAKRASMADDRCRAFEDFMRRPDRLNSWDQWLRMLVEEQLVIDAASIFVRRTLGGDVYSLEIIDGSLVKPLIDHTGRAPMPPDAAYQQVLKGMPAVDYTREELIYAPRNPRVDHLYGLSPVEQMVMTINIAVRREVVKLNYFTSNNIPEAIVSVPKEWGPEKIAQFQIMWDALLRSQENQAGLKFVPGEMNFQATRSDGMLMGAFDEWIARVVCFAFSLPPTAFVQQQNRATAETASDTALEEGLAPLMVWFKSIMDRIIQDVFGYSDLEFTWDDTKQLDVGESHAQDIADIENMVLSPDEVRAKRGLDPIGLGFYIRGGPNGIIFLDDLLAAKKAGLTAIQAPPAAPQLDEFGNPVPAPAPGLPAPPPQLALPAPAASAGTPAPQASLSSTSNPTNDALSGIPASLLAAVGLGPDGDAGRNTDVTRGNEIQSDPEMAHVPHPQVLSTLRAAEAMHKRAPSARALLRKIK